MYYFTDKGLEVSYVRNTKQRTQPKAMSAVRNLVLYIIYCKDALPKAGRLMQDII